MSWQVILKNINMDRYSANLSSSPNIKKPKTKYSAPQPNYKNKLGNLLDDLLNMKISEEEYKRQKEKLDSEFL